MRAYVLVAICWLAGCGPDEPVSRSIGARCDFTDECDDRCLGPSAEFPDGFCSLDCTTNSDCPDLSECIDKDGGVCLFRCFDDRDCSFLGSGWLCKEKDLRDGGKVNVCIGD